MADPRDPDLIQVISKLQSDLDELTKNVIARSGRVPNVAVDPTAPPDGSVWVRSDLGEFRYRSNGTTRFTPGAGAGPPSGVGSNGEQYYDTTNKRLYLSDGVGWCVMSEPYQNFGALSVAPTAGAFGALGAISLNYHRSDGILEYDLSFGLTTNGTGAGVINFTIPVVSFETHIGNGREVLVTGKTLSVSHNSAGVGSIVNYDNTYPGASGAAYFIHGRYRMLTRYN